MHVIYIFLQHPFISNALDNKPLRELISEHKAEVFEEVTEEDDDHEVIYLLIFENVFDLCILSNQLMCLFKFILRFHLVYHHHI